MKTRLFILLGILPALTTGCYTYTGVTYTPTRTSTPVYNSYGTTYGTTATGKNYSASYSNYCQAYDLCQNLDLQAISVAFAQSASIQDFEILINNSSRYISNLDLNNDGYVDYIRVVESYEGNVHVLLLQAVLGYNAFQDLATIVVENPRLSSWHIEIIGAPYLYGPNYYVRPVFHNRPLILDHFAARTYVRWNSPWRWGSYPEHYRHQAPLIINNYQIRINNYMGSNRYCHEVKYPSAPHYNNYEVISRQYQRNDYGAQHPDHSFTNRTANVATQNSAVARAAAAGQTIRNANDITRIQTAAETKTTGSRTAASSASGTRTSGTSASASRTSGTTDSRTGSTTSSTTRNSGTSTSASRTSSTSTSGTRTSGTTSSTTGSRSSATTTKSSTSRSSSSKSSATKASSSTKSSSSRSSAKSSSSTKSSNTKSSSESGSGTSSSRSGSSSSTSSSRSSSSSSSRSSR